MLLILHFVTGAVSQENMYPILYPNHRFVKTELQCSGMESNITNCTQNLNETFSCLPSGVASVSCYCEFSSVPSHWWCMKRCFSSYFHLQLEIFPMHLALMVQYDSKMGLFRGKAGWRSVSTMPGGLCVMMVGTMQMLQ